MFEGVSMLLPLRLATLLFLGKGHTRPGNYFSGWVGGWMGGWMVGGWLDFLTIKPSQPPNRAWVGAELGKTSCITVDW